jgi:hypothetical protein
MARTRQGLIALSLVIVTIGAPMLTLVTTGGSSAQVVADGSHWWPDGDGPPSTTP